MTTNPDFEALRAERNATMRAFVKRMRADGWSVSYCAARDEDACYCDCGNGGPCEHNWTGPEWVSEDGCMASVTCFRCGMMAISHSMRVGP